MDDDTDHFCRSLALMLYVNGWDAHKAGKPYEESEARSWQEGWKLREDHEIANRYIS